MDEVRPRQYSDTIKVKTLGDDLDIKDVQSINESELQSYLMGDPVPDINDLDEGEIQKIDKKAPPSTDDDPDDDIPSVSKKAKKQEDVSEGEVEEYLNEDIPDKPKKKTKEPDAKLDNQEEDENIFATLNRDLVKAGIFSEEDDVEDVAGFKDKFVREIQRNADNMLGQFLSQHGPEYQAAFDAIFVKGMAPESYFRHVDVIDDLEGMDLKSTDNQERLLKTYYKSQKYSPSAIAKKLENLKDSGFMEDEASAVHEIMVNDERERLDVEVREAEQEARRRQINRENYKASINKMLSDKVKTKSFDGIPVDPRVAGKIYHNLTADAYKLPDGRLITEFDKMIMELDMPENFEKKLKLAFLLEKGLDLSDIQKQAIKNETEETFQGLQRKKSKKEIPSVSPSRSFFQ